MRAVEVKLRRATKALGYGSLELVTARRGIRRTVDGTPIRFPARCSRYYPREYDPAKQAFIVQHCRPGATALDAGAHMGLYTVAMARGVGPYGRVFAFEPAPDTCAALRRTVALNRCTNVEVRRQAISDAGGQRPLYLTGDPCANANSLTAGRGSRAIPVSTVSIDHVLARSEGPVSLLKLDIEGAELEALQGANETIARWHPAIAVEVHPAELPNGPESLCDLWDLLVAHGYRAVKAGRALDRDWFCAQRSCFEIGASFAEIV